MKKYIPFLTLIVIITSLVFFKCSNYEEEKKKNYEDYSDKSLITILHINQNYENHRLKGKVKKLKVKTFGLNPQPLNPKEKNDFIKSLYHEKIFEFDSLTWGLLGLSAGVFGTLGDLFESSLKRYTGVKDSGNIMPGHGGLLDRFDGFFFLIPVAWIILQLV